MSASEMFRLKAFSDQILSKTRRFESEQHVKKIKEFMFGTHRLTVAGRLKGPMNTILKDLIKQSNPKKSTMLSDYNAL